MFTVQQPGTIIRKRYRILRVLGQGGTSITYEAEDLVTHQRVALKELSLKGLSDWKQLTLFEREAQVLANLAHPAIPRYLAYFQVDTAENRFFYIVQTLVSGHSLADAVKQGKRFSEAEVRHIALEVLAILNYLHRLNPPVIHRDIKPQNLIRCQSGRIFLVDFGAVQAVYCHTLAVGSTLVGTHGYMAPEQFQGRAYPATDLYGLGTTLLTLLTHQLPFELPQKRLKYDFRGYVQVSSRFSDWLERLLEPWIEDRFDSASIAIAALTPWIGTKPCLVPATSSGVSERLSRRRAIQIMGFTVGGLGALLGGSALLRNKSEVPVPPMAERDFTPFDFEVVTVNEKGEIVSQEIKQAQVFQELIGDVILKMVSIPGGTFMMGSPLSEAERHEREGPQHEVTVHPFMMGMYEVTQAQWQAVAALPRVERDLYANPSYMAGENRPVVNLSWDDATEFCQRLSKHTGRVYRLPSEAEWEFACRAETTTPFHFGATVTTDLVNFNGHGTYASAPKGERRGQTTDVDSFSANAFGLYDMHGNVREWCLDHWHSDYYGAPRDGSAWLSGIDSSSRMLRSGSWYYHPVACRSASRTGCSRDTRKYDLGFRVVSALTLSQKREG